jgi:hypothetical protein
MLGGNFGRMPGSNMDTLPPGMRLREKEKHKIRTILGRNRVSTTLNLNYLLFYLLIIWPFSTAYVFVAPQCGRRYFVRAGRQALGINSKTA